MAIKFGRPIEMRDAPRHQTAQAAPALDLTVRPRRNRKAEWARRAGAGKRSDHQRSDLAAVRDRRRQQAPERRLDAGVERLSVDQAVRDAERAMKLNIPASRCSLYRPVAARRARLGGHQPRQSGLPVGARDQKSFRVSACSATSPSIPSPATAMTG